MKNFKKLGFETYDDYLKSKLWKWIKGRLFKGRKRGCKVCKKTNCLLHVHHRSYDLPVMKGADLKQLVILCEECHNKIEFTKNGEKRKNLDEINYQLDFLLGKIKTDKQIRREARRKKQREHNKNQKKKSGAGEHQKAKLEKNRRRLAKRGMSVPGDPKCLKWFYEDFFL